MGRCTITLDLKSKPVGPREDRKYIEPIVGNQELLVVIFIKVGCLKVPSDSRMKNRKFRREPCQLPQEKCHLIRRKPASGIARKFCPLEKVGSCWKRGSPGTMMTSTVNLILQRKVEEISMFKAEW